MAKRTAITAVFCVLMCVNAGASMVSFYVIETGVPENRRENQYSVFWENAFLDVFFDAGHIVCNAPILSLQGGLSGDILHQVNMLEVRDAGIDFVIIARLDYNSGAVPSEMFFYVFRVNPREKLYERQLEGREARPVREELEYMKTIARGLVTYVD